MLKRFLGRQETGLAPLVALALVLDFEGRNRHDAARNPDRHICQRSCCDYRRESVPLVGPNAAGVLLRTHKEGCRRDMIEPGYKPRRIISRRRCEERARRILKTALKSVKPDLRSRVPPDSRRFTED